MSIKKLASKQRELRRLRDEMADLIGLFLKNNEFIEGSYIEVLQKCGRPTCHCKDKPTHLVSRLSKWVDGKLTHKVVRIEDRDRVRKLVEIYKQHKTAMAKLTKEEKKEKKS